MSETLNYLLAPIRAWMDEPGVEDLCLSPGTCFVWKNGRFEKREVALDADDLVDIAIVAGAQRRRDINRDWPLLQVDLPGMGRLYSVIYPCVPEGQPSLTIRMGGGYDPTFDALVSSGYFRNTVIAGQTSARPSVDHTLTEFYRDDQLGEFCRRAVRARKTILLSGENAAGKTSVSRALVKEIPLHERLITLEDTPEWAESIPHENRVSLLYDKDGKGPRPRHLVEAALRMRTGRFLHQEIRDSESALAFLTVLQSGHSGSITTIHSGSAGDVFNRLRLLIRETSAGAAMDGADITERLRQLIDVVIHCDLLPEGGRQAREVLWVRAPE